MPSSLGSPWETLGLSPFLVILPVLWSPLNKYKGTSWPLFLLERVSLRVPRNSCPLSLATAETRRREKLSLSLSLSALRSPVSGPICITRWLLCQARTPFVIHCDSCFIAESRVFAYKVAPRIRIYTWLLMDGPRVFLFTVRYRGIISGQRGIKSTGLKQPEVVCTESTESASGVTGVAFNVFNVFKCVRSS